MELTRALGHRIIEFHLKDVKPEQPRRREEARDRNDPMTDPIFFPLGKGGVDFPGSKRTWTRSAGKAG